MNAHARSNLEEPLSSHMSDEELSAYLDDELASPRLRLVEDHLEQCPPCRQRRRDLGRLVGRVRQLEEQAPPPALGTMVLARARLARGRRPWLQRLEAVLPGPVSRQSPLGYSFALVIALAACLYGFAGWMEWRQTPAPSFEVPPAERAIVDGRTFSLWEEGVWVQEGIPEAALGSARDIVLQSEEGQATARRWPGAATLARASAADVVFRDGAVVSAAGEASVQTPAPLLRLRSIDDGDPRGQQEGTKAGAIAPIP